MPAFQPQESLLQIPPSIQQISINKAVRLNPNQQSCHDPRKNNKIQKCLKTCPLAWEMQKKCLRIPTGRMVVDVLPQAEEMHTRSNPFSIG